MNAGEKLYVIYLIGLVTWTTIGYLVNKSRGNEKNLELLSLVFGALWFIFVPWQVWKALKERK